MKALFGGHWAEGLADYHRPPGTYRVETLAACPLERLEGLYPVRSRRDLRMVWNYARAIGVPDTLRKVASRSCERFRNEKYVSCGLGRVLEAPSDASLAEGETVVFLWPAGPACAERLVLPAELLSSVEGERLPELPADQVAVLECPADEPRWWDALRGWRAESGETLPRFAASMALKEAQRLLLGADWRRARRLPRGEEPVCTRLASRVPSSPRASRGRRSAVLFGYGNYAKTILLPRVGRHLRVDRIHELDPAQIPLRRRDGAEWSTSPVLEPGERPDAVFVAGYHHTHAPLACEALRRGAAAVVEKPIATTRAQLHELLATLRETRGTLFSGYQRRHLLFNGWLREDLGVAATDPISYHAVVYEVPLPELHWYRWPVSRSRLVSNGCHWIDHFLYLNGFPAVSDLDVRVGPDGTMNCSVVAENGAFFTMVLTNRGSRRLGVRDYVELQAGGATARIVDACRYEAENRHRIVRRGRIGRLEPYRAMYDTIGRLIAEGAPGESPVAVQRSAGLVLDLEEQLVRGRSARAGVEMPEMLLDGLPRPWPAIRSGKVATAA